MIIIFSVDNSNALRDEKDSRTLNSSCSNMFWHTNWQKLRVKTDKHEGWTSILLHLWLVRGNFFPFPVPCPLTTVHWVRKSMCKWRIGNIQDLSQEARITGRQLQIPWICRSLYSSTVSFDEIYNFHICLLLSRTDQ